LFFSYLDAFVLTFAIVGSIIKLVVAPTDSGMKDLRCRGDHADKQMIAREPPVGVETVHTCEASVLDVSLVSGRWTKTINHGIVCGLLVDCLQDV
jgi:hypothetical protein